jgi:hypothetical protein
MKSAQKSAVDNAAQSGPAAVRSGEIVTASGTWLARCWRDKCCAVVVMTLHQSAPAPPCVRCLNMTARWRFLHGPARVELPAEAATLPREPQHAPAAIPPTESVHSACGSADADEQNKRFRLGIAPPAPAAETAAADPTEQKKTEAPPIADAEPSLIEKLRGKSSRKKIS